MVPGFLFVVVCVGVTSGEVWTPRVQRHPTLDRESKSFDNAEPTRILQPSSLSQRINYPDPARPIQGSRIEHRSARDLDTATFAFRPRSLPVKRSDHKPVYYTKDNYSNRYKTEVLFPGNYYSISKEKSVRDDHKTQLTEQFKPHIIPLIRGRAFEKRSLNVESPDEDTAPVMAQRNAQYDPNFINNDLQQRSDVYNEKPKEESMVSKFISAMKRINEIKDQKDLFTERSLSYILGGGDGDSEDDDNDDNEEVEEEEVASPSAKNKIKHKIKKVKKYSKYMMPLLLAYKLKYFALVPVLISGLVLLVGATGLAGFFFALFAAVMGLQKGGY